MGLPLWMNEGDEVRFSRSEQALDWNSNVKRKKAAWEKALQMHQLLFSFLFSFSYSFCVQTRYICLTTKPWHCQSNMWRKKEKKDTKPASYRVPARQGPLSLMNESPLLLLTPRERRREQREKKRALSFFSSLSLCVSRHFLLLFWRCHWGFGFSRQRVKWKSSADGGSQRKC